MTPLYRNSEQNCVAPNGHTRTATVRRLSIASSSALGYTPSAVSQQLSALEREARVALLDRTARSAELTDAVRRVSQLADQRSHAVKLSVSNEGVEIPASSPEYGEAKENIDKEYKGDAISIGFNSSYMLDFLAAAAEGPISIELKDEQSAGQMRPLADESYRYRYIIMPMRI